MSETDRAAVADKTACDGAEPSTAGLAWTAHPLRQEHPAKSLALVAVICGFSALAAMSLGSLAYGVVSAALLLAAMTRYLLPTRYELDDREAAWRQLVWHRRSWTSFRRVDRHSDGLFLSPFRRPNRLDAFRGVFLRFGPSVDGSAVADLVESRVSL